MLYRLLADAVLLVHLGFIVFAIFGALLLLWRTAFVWLHAPALCWALAVEFLQLRCPLTDLENHLRHMAGQQGYAGGFIEHYLLPVIYPPGLTANWQVLLGMALLIFNLVLYALAYRRAKR